MFHLLFALFLAQPPIASGVESWAFEAYTEYVQKEDLYYRDLYKHKKEVLGVRFVGDSLVVESSETSLPLQSGLSHLLIYMEAEELRHRVLSTLEKRGMSKEDLLYLREIAPVGVNNLDALNECYQQGYTASPSLHIFNQPTTEIPAFESLVDAVRTTREIQSACRQDHYWNILDGLSGHGRRLVVDFAVTIQGAGASMRFQTVEAEANEWLSAFKEKKAPGQ
ncbi:hypothetical protein [Acanthopleuribacter pedis]|uniref:Uncharacterized protein n=1 Tax=Acanthopleuribacter pedis TaxID=442870 RepID=A0A8J7Q5G1_9BACT|nr:hypothetical protein [Acanthopleuribacter pedis]MBO1319440.1 hypothetical protein [Acanthopleuribacter pedis]